MTRTVVLRASAACASIPATILNNDIGLDPFLSYSIKEHLEDLASEGISLLSAEGNLYRFSDGSVCFLDEQQVYVDERALDLETVILVRAHKATLAMRSRIHAVSA